MTMTRLLSPIDPTSCGRRLVWGRAVAAGMLEGCKILPWSAPPAGPDAPPRPRTDVIHRTHERRGEPAQGYRPEHLSQDPAIRQRAGEHAQSAAVTGLSCATDSCSFQAAVTNVSARVGDRDPRS